jgi:hypothetical protein
MRSNKKAFPSFGSYRLPHRIHGSAIQREDVRATWRDKSACVLAGVNGGPFDFATLRGDSMTGDVSACG